MSASVAAPLKGFTTAEALGMRADTIVGQYLINGVSLFSPDGVRLTKSIWIDYPQTEQEREKIQSLDMRLKANPALRKAVIRSLRKTNVGPQGFM